LNKNSNILIILLVLAILVILIPNKWSKFLNDTSQIELENKNLLEENEKSKAFILVLQDSLKLDSIKMVKLEEEGRKIDSLSVLKDLEIARKKKQLNEITAEYKEIMKKIEYIKANPNNKRGEELLFSIDSRLKK